MSWTAPSGHVFTTAEAVTAATMNTYIANNLTDLDRRATAVHAEVDANQTTTSTSYVDLATVGPAITVATGALCLVGLSVEMANSGVGEGFTAPAVSDATTVAAADVISARHSSSVATYWGFWGTAWAYSALTPGNNTFTLKYRVGGGTGSFINRRIWALPLGAA